MTVEKPGIEVYDLHEMTCETVGGRERFVLYVYPQSSSTDVQTAMSCLQVLIPFAFPALQTCEMSQSASND